MKLWIFSFVVSCYIVIGLIYLQNKKIAADVAVIKNHIAQQIK